MAHDQLLGLDVGTSRIKALLIDENGSSVKLSAVETPFRRGAAGTDMQPGDLLDAAGRAIAGLGDLTGVRGVGIATLGESGSFVRPSGQLSRLPIIAWHDPRGTEVARALRQHFGDDLVERTGRPARPVSTIAKLGWMRAAGADLSGTWLGVGGLLTWALTGAKAQERSLAATSGAFDPITGEYLPDVLAAAGLGDVTFAPVSLGGSAHGRVHEQGAAWSGLPVGIPVTIAGHDHAVGAVGAGAGIGEIIDSMGSGEPVFAALPAQASISRLRARLAPLQGHATITAWPGADAPAVHWERLRPGFGLGRLAGLLGRDRDVLEGLAALCGPQTPWSNAMIDVLETGPEGDPRLAEHLAAHRAQDFPGATFAAALDGYAELTAQADADLRSETASSSATIVIGGGMRSGRWLAAKQARTVFGLRLVDEPESTARGAALLAGVAAGIWAGPEAFPAPSERLG